MKLVTFAAGGAPRVGARTDDGQIVDLNYGYSAMKKTRGEATSEWLAGATVPADARPCR